MRLRDNKSIYPMVLLTNIRSLLPKIEEIRIISTMKKPDIICITETWLDSSVDSTLIHIPGYLLCRTDRNDRRGGGTAVYIRSDIIFEDLSNLASSSNCCGSEISVIHIPHFCVFLILVYIPPNVRAQALQELHDLLVGIVDDVLAKVPNHHLMILGDFNHFKVDHLCNDLDLVDLIVNPTRKDRILDHFLVSRELTDVYVSGSVTYDAPISTSDHVMLTVTPSGFSSDSVSRKSYIVHDLRKSYLDDLAFKTSQVNWGEIFKHGDDVDILWTNFYSVISQLISEVVPSKTVWISSTDKEWMTPLTKLLINERWEAYRRKDWKRYNELKFKVKLEIRRSKIIQANKLKNSAYGLWKFVKVTAGNKNKDDWSNLVSQHGSIDSLLSSIVSVLKRDISDPDTAKMDETSLIDDDWSINFSLHGIANLLRKLSSHKSGGIDGIPNKIYAALAENIATPLKSIYEASIAQRKFPSAWKTGIVTPIPKTSPADITKLRPITLLPSPAKVLEKIVLREVKQYYEVSSSRCQHAFKLGHSTTTALVELNEVLTQAFDAPTNFGVGLLCFDLSKAFDCVDHSCAIKKFKEQKFPSGHLLWLRSYLTGRNCVARIQGKLSSSFNVHRGVPQGSVLGPAIFCAYTGDYMARSDSATAVKYADDISVVFPIASRNTNCIIASINNEIQHIEEWCSANNLILNKEKTKIMIHTRLPVTLPASLKTETKVKILGTIFSNNLTWDANVQQAVSKFNQRFHVLRKLKNVVSRQELHQIFVATMRPLLEYASPVYVSLTGKLEKRMQRLNKRVHKLIWSNSDIECDCDEEMLRRRRENTSKELFKRILKTPRHSLCRYLPSQMRHSKRLTSFFCRTEKRRQSFFPFVTELINGEQ